MEPNVDDLPLAIRRKRRPSSALSDPDIQEIISQQFNEDAATQGEPFIPPKTPGNRKKKARFSEPIVSNVASSSTGLTPALTRTKIIPEKTLKKTGRFSLPSQLMTPAVSPSSAEFSQSPSPTVIQFAPIRQAIGARMMRRLKRNHLSQEVNEIEAEKKKSKLELQQEIEDLRNELVLAQQHRNAAMNSDDETSVNAARIADLENELGNLKQEMREQSVTAAPLTGLHEEESSLPSMVLDQDSAFDIYADPENSDHQREISVFPSPGLVVEAATQASIPSPTFSDVFRSARLALERLFPGEIPLGLDVNDPQPLVDTLIERLRNLKSEAMTIGHKVSVSETSQTNMRNHFDTALQQLERDRKFVDFIKAKVTEEKERACSAELEVATLEARVEQIGFQCSNAEKERNETKRSVERLLPALEHYQNEVTTLTQTIMNLEASHEVGLEAFRDELAGFFRHATLTKELAFEEAKSDLQAQIAAETTGRRKAEESAVERLDRIRELEHRGDELQAAVHEKQSIIRDLESNIEHQKLTQENEVGQLNVRIGELVSDLSSTNAELASIREEKLHLASMVEQEKAAGLRAVQAMQSGMHRCASELDAVKDDHVEGVKQRGEQVAQSFGLMTPVVEGGRFRNAEVDEKVEGRVEVDRGKGRERRPDSGVGIWDIIAEEGEGDAEEAMME
ncbi:MAG: hypothetical protein Q9222_006741 [Ikaeria aurantiellina]